MAPTWSPRGSKNLQKPLVFQRFSISYIFAQIVSSWANLGQLGTHLRPTWANLGPTWGQLGACLSQNRATLGHLGANLGRLGPAWASSGQLYRAMFGSTWAHFGFNLAQLEFQVAPTAVQQTAESAVRNHWSKGLFETAPGQTHQRTCPTNCSSRAATVERLSRSTTYSSTDDSFGR